MRPSCIVTLLFAGACQASAADWPQWMGPTRDNVWRETNVIDEFPTGGPKVIWRANIAGGYAGPSIAQGRVFVTDYVTAENVKVDNFQRKTFSGLERVLCLDEKSGKQAWKHEYPVQYSISYPAGPRCTPLVHQGKVYTLGAEGNLFCFEADSGKILWSKNLVKEYRTKAALWGYAGHPLIDGQRLLCVCGGEGSHLVAFDKDNGKELWRALTSPEQGYSPPTIFEAGGARQLVLLRPDAVTSIDAESGKEYWTVPYKASSGSIIMSPVRWQDYIYIGGFSNKNLLLKLDADRPAAKIVWRNQRRRGISPVNVQPIVDGGILYGFDQSGSLHAVDLPSGKRLWGTAQPLGKRPVQSGTAFIVKQADRFWMFTEKGDLVIAQLTRKGYEEVDRAKVLDPTNVAFGRDVVWAAPAFANRRVYLRNDAECVCIDLSKR